MSRNKASQSLGKSYKEIAEFWDEHDLTDFWDQTKEAAMEVDIASEETYFSLDKTLSSRLRKVAKKRGVSADTLINLWVQERLQIEKAERS